MKVRVGREVSGPPGERFPGSRGWGTIPHLGAGQRRGGGVSRGQSATSILNTRGERGRREADGQRDRKTERQKDKSYDD